MSCNRSFIILFMCVLLASCVGAVKEDPEKTDQTDISGDDSQPQSSEDDDQSGGSNESAVSATSEDKIPQFSFKGIKRIEPASDTKLTIWFEPVMITLNGETYPAIPPSPDPITGQTDVMYMYEIVKDEVSGSSSTPPVAAFPDSGLNLNTNGEFAVTVDVGESATCGIYNVIARDIKDGAKFNPGVYFRACTYNYYFPDFSGVNYTEERQGCARDNGVILNWKIATRADQLTTDIDRLTTAKEEMFQKVLDLANPLDYSEYAAFELTTNQEIKRITQYTPTSYLLYWDTDEANLIERLTNPSSLPNATVANINTTSFNVDGLESGVTYYFNIRAKTDIVEERNGSVIDRNFNIYPFTVPSKVEVQFSGVSQVTIPTDFLGYSEAVLNFTPCIGCNIYRIWKFEGEIPTEFNIDNTTDLIDTIDLDQTGVIDSYRARGLQRHKNYFFKIAALKMCDGISVQDFKTGVEGEGKTSPILAPFNGVKSVYSTGSLTSLNINWNLPDTSNGVYDSYRLYMTINDGDIIELRNSDEDESDNLGNLIPRVANRFSFNNKELEQLTVRNLTAGKNPQNTNKYCFAIGIKESDVNGDNGVGKTTALEDLKFKCLNFHFTPPIFYGPKIGQCDADSTSFRVKFDLPDIGTFDEARIYYKEYRQDGDFGYLGEEDDFGILDSGTLVDYSTVEEDTKIVLPTDIGSGLTGDNNPWTRIVLHHNPDATPRLETPGILEETGWVINDEDPIIPILNLKADTTYIYAVELFYDPPERDPIYIRPQLAEKCRTEKPKVVHNGWAHILAVGKKTNGLLGNRWIPEKLMLQDGPSADSFGEYSDSIGDSIPYHLAENNNIDPVTGINNITGNYEGTEGIVHLSWFDFKLSLTGNYANSLIEGYGIGATKDGFYYAIERADNREMTNPVDLGSIDVKKGIYLYHFVDSSIPKGNHKYYYRVNLKRGDIFNFSQNNSEGNEEKAINQANTILEVVVPPPNMSFIHRFMINKHNCRKIDKSIFQGYQAFKDLEDDDYLNFSSISSYAEKSPRADLYLSPPNHNYDLSKNYRCPYRGMGAVMDENGDFYYDISRSYFIDRFEMGIDIGATAERLESKEFSDENINEYAKKCMYGGERVICANSLSLSALSAKHNTLLYSTIKLPKPGTYDNGPNIYKQTGSVEGDPDAYMSNWSVVTPNSQMISNSAYLPPAPLKSVNTMKSMCATRQVELSNETLKGRLPSRQELLFMSENYDHLSTLNMYEIQRRLSLASGPSSLGSLLHFGCNTSIYPPADKSKKTDYTLLFRNKLAPEVTDNNYPSGHEIDARLSGYEFVSTPHLLRSGSYSSDESNQSSHLCVSKFGVQDLVGNLPELTGDVFYLNNEGDIHLDLAKMGGEDYLQIINLWKMTPLGLTQDEGSIDYSQSQVSMNNYYNSFYGMFYKMNKNSRASYPGFLSVEKEFPWTVGDIPFWNPITATTFNSPSSRSSVAQFIDAMFEDMSGISAELLFDDGINPVVLDEDNFNFGNLARGKTTYVPAPLVEKSSAQGYNPFFYETKEGTTQFSIQSPITCNCGNFGADSASLDNYRSTNLLFGGSGYSMASPSNNKNNEGQAIKLNTTWAYRSFLNVEYNQFQQKISNYTTMPYLEHDYLYTRTGFRCVFPISENVAE